MAELVTAKILAKLNAPDSAHYSGPALVKRVLQQTHDEILSERPDFDGSEHVSMNAGLVEVLHGRGKPSKMKVHLARMGQEAPLVFRPAGPSTSRSVQWGTQGSLALLIPALHEFPIQVESRTLGPNEALVFSSDGALRKEEFHAGPEIQFRWARGWSGRRASDAILLFQRHLKKLGSALHDDASALVIRHAP